MISIDEKSIKGRQVGEGRYGKVFQCKTSRRMSAVKFVSKEITNAESTIRELRAYQIIDNQCPNIAVMLGHHINNEKSYIFLKMYDCDLRVMIRSNIDFCPYNFIKDIACSLDFLKSKSIVHADVKPENILYDCNEDKFVLCDFGISLFHDDKKEKTVQSIRYRAPEVMARLDYSFPMDVFSLGCIIYEITSNSYFLDSTEDYINFISIISRLGMPDKDYYKQLYGIFLSDSPSEFKHPQKGKIPITFTKDIYLEDVLFGDLLMSCLETNPEDRITPKKILAMIEN